MNTCNEIFLEDIVKVRVYFVDNCLSAIPSTVGGVKEAQVSLGTPVIELGLTAEGLTGTATGLLSQSASVKVTNAIEKAGNIYTHEVSATVEHGITDIAEYIGKVSGRNVHLIYIKADGTMYLTHTLQNTVKLTMEDNLGSQHTMTFKATMKSLSGLISATT